MKKRALFGLGNPGEAYYLTRHNVGYRVVEATAKGLGASPFISVRYALWSEVKNKGIHWHFFLPTTYMNLSGNAVAYWRSELELALEELLVVVDEIQLPVGRMRLTPSGSAGGHNGLAHVIERLGTQKFPRLRIGIGNDFPKGKQVEYVLSPFTPQQEEVFQQLLPHAVNCLLKWGKEGIERTMSEFNTLIIPNSLEK
ncbi:MAG: aminoacyl-tRNA hydrolase [Bacteroidia bacterium]|nr:aminoacyl-tRNA hydrolase [Bacteroidia bacterium]MDW8133527.1 aminoacyl-tRNA hydrolase [Bacteroidia bacterium]